MRTGSVPQDRPVDDLGYLPARGAVARPEFQACRAARVAADDGVGICRLYKGVERMVIGHVLEGRCRRIAERPPRGYHHNLGQLTTCYVVAGAELQATGATTVPRYHVFVNSGLDVRVKGVVSWHIPECRRWRGIGG